MAWKIRHSRRRPSWKLKQTRWGKLMNQISWPWIAEYSKWTNTFRISSRNITIKRMSCSRLFWLCRCRKKKRLGWRSKTKSCKEKSMASSSDAKTWNRSWRYRKEMTDKKRLRTAWNSRSERCEKLMQNSCLRSKKKSRSWIYSSLMSRINSKPSMRTLFKKKLLQSL